VNPISEAAKTRLKSAVLALRHLLADDLVRGLNHLNIDVAREDTIPASKLSYLTDSELAIGAGLDAALAKQRAMARNFMAVVKGLRREATRTSLRAP
jgi:hypothetical protein